MAPRSNRSASRSGIVSNQSASGADAPGMGAPECSAPEYTRTSERRGKPPRDEKGRKTLSLRARAVGYLSRREHSRLELERKLFSFAEDAESVRSLLDALEKEGWLCNARFATSLVHRRAPLRGTMRIVSELRQSGVDDDQIATLQDTLRSTEYDRAREVWKKRFDGDTPADRATYAKQARFLAGRGFSGDVIHKILGEPDDE